MATKQYQVVILRLQGKARDDEEALTDLLNERARTGWMFETSASLGGNRVMAVFARQA
jgi:hypothetical protein